MSRPTPEQIRALRKSAGLLQKEYGALICVPMHMIQNWEAGRGTMPQVIFELSQIKISEIGRVGRSGAAVPAKKGVKMVDLKEIFKQFSTIDLELVNQALHDQIVRNKTKNLADFERTKILHEKSREELVTRTDR